jgi:hypothetical protein
VSSFFRLVSLFVSSIHFLLVNRCLDISPCCRVLSALTGISRCKMTSQVKVLYRSISWARRWLVDLLPDEDDTNGLCSTELERIYSQRTCTSLRIECVIPVSLLYGSSQRSFFFCFVFSDPVLGARVKTWWIVDPALCQISLRCDRCARPSPSISSLPPPRLIPNT